jgi:hypothetical protein
LQRASIALKFIERWNDPKLSELRNSWHNLYYDLKKLEPAQTIQKLTEDAAARTVVTDVLNFFEEVAQAVNSNAADEALTQRLLGETIRDYYGTVLPWVNLRRTTRPDAWVEITAMLERFSQK